MATYRDIFELVQSLSKGERRNLHVLASQWGRQPIHLKVLEDLYRMDSLDLEKLRRKFKCDDRVIQRAIRKILEIILQSRSIFEPGPRETVARDIADISYLLEKGMPSLALDQIERSLLPCRQKELFEEHRQLLNIRRRLTGEMREADDEADRVESQQCNHIAYLSLRERMKADLEDSRSGKTALRLRSILIDDLLTDPDQALSLKAEFQRLSIRWRIHNYLRDYDKMILDLEQAIKLLQEHQETLDPTWGELLEHRFILAQVYITRSQVDRARNIMNSIEQMELYAADLIAKRFEKYCLTQLGFACDVGDDIAGTSALNLMDRHFARYMVSISPMMQRLLLYMSAKFSFYRGDFAEADQYIRKIMSMAMVDQFSDFIPFAKTIQLLSALEEGDVDNIDNKVRSLQRVLNTQEPDHELPQFALQLVKSISKELPGQELGVVRKYLGQTEEITASEFDYFEFKLYLQARMDGVTMLELSASRIAADSDQNQAAGA
jgi:hypothetical protein